MKKQIVIPFMVIFIIMGSLLRAEDLKSGEAAVFLRDGGKLIGEIVDISSRRLVLELKEGPDIKLYNIWMINFINTKWYFPEERSQIETSQHYIFLRNGDITAGKIIDFSSRLRVFELDTEEKIPIGRVRRIYFSKNVPDEFEKPIVIKKPKTKKIKKVIKK